MGWMGTVGRVRLVGRVGRVGWVGTKDMLRTLMIVAGVMMFVHTGSAQTQPRRPAPSPPPASPAPSTAPASSTAAGKAAYTKNGCWQCHGQQAQGGAAGPRLGPRPMPLAALTAYVRTPAGEMPPYTAKVLSDRDVADIHAFLSALPAPAPVADIPLLAK